MTTRNTTTEGQDEQSPKGTTNAAPSSDAGQAGAPDPGKASETPPPAEAKDAGAAKGKGKGKGKTQTSEGIPALRVTAKRDGFRRAGRPWSTTATTVPVGEFDDEQVELLRNEPMLVVEDTVIEG